MPSCAHAHQIPFSPQDNCNQSNSSMTVVDREHSGSLEKGYTFDQEGWGTDWDSETFK